MTTSRYIDLSQYDADPRVMAWLEANALDPNHVPAAQHAHVTGGHLVIQKFETGPDGHKIPLHDRITGELCGWQKVTVTVPLHSSPEEHNL